MAALVVVSAAALASANMVPGFQFLGEMDFGSGVVGIPVLPGQVNEIDIAAIGEGDVAAMSLYLEVDAPFEIQDLSIDDIGGVFNLNSTPPTSTGEDIYTADRRPDLILVRQLAVGYVTTPGPTVAVHDGDLLAKVFIYVPDSMQVGDMGVLTTDSPSLGMPSDFSDPAAQDEVNLIVIPEPVTALLLLAAVPLLWRRRA